MITVTFTVSDISSLKQALQLKLAQKVGRTAEKIYNKIVSGEISTPYYSGSYISSWNINVGSINGSFNYEPWKKGTFFAPDQSQGLFAPPNTPVYVSNLVPHASRVENDGTPKHPEPWKVAFHAIRMLAVA